MAGGSEWVPICEDIGDKPVEIETEHDGTLPLTSVTAHFPGTTTLKYTGPTGSERAVKLTSENILLAPSGGWQTAQFYVCVNPQKEVQRKKMEIEASMKRKAQVEDQLRGGGVEPDTKMIRWGPPKDDDDELLRDLILLGMSPKTTEIQVRQYFAGKEASLGLCQMKKSKDGATGYAFIKFLEKDVEIKLRRQRHVIDERECTLKIPDSRMADGGERGEKKVYVSYQDSSLTKDELRAHFEQFGDVEDVFIPTPWRYFAFVTFASANVAQSLIGKEHNVRGVSLLMKRGQKPGTRSEPGSSMPSDGGSRPAAGPGGEEYGGHSASGSTSGQTPPAGWGGWYGYGAPGAPPQVNWGGHDGGSGAKADGSGAPNETSDQATINGMSASAYSAYMQNAYAYMWGQQYGSGGGQAAASSDPPPLPKGRHPDDSGRKGFGGPEGGSRCYKCNNRGHFARECPEEQDHCYKCNGVGHISRNCRE